MVSEREILFRGKRLDTGKWVEGHYFKNENGTFIFTFPYHANYAGIDVMVKVAPETVGQYTGLLDKTGKRIFEGDITLAHLAETVTRGYEGFEWPSAETVFDNGAFCRKERRQTLPFWNYAPHVEFEIIGTVYDNPELLEVRAE